MEREELLASLHPLEVKVLKNLKQEKTLSASTIMHKLSYNIGQANQVLSWLLQKALISIKSKEQITSYSLTELGKGYLQKGTPEERLIACLKQVGPLTLPKLANQCQLENRDAGSAFGQLAKDGVVKLDAAKRVCLLSDKPPVRLTQIRKLLELFQNTEQLSEAEIPPELRSLAAELGKKRGAANSVFKITEKELVEYSFTAQGLKLAEQLEAMGISGDEIGTLTPELLKNGEWKHRGFRAYNLNTPPQRVLLGRKNPYVAFLDQLKDKLISLGFEEYDGPLVETEFWNSDALFMPQFHPARDIHDVYYLKDPQYAKEIEEPYLSNVAATHENGWQTGSRGWRYQFDRNFTRKLILRSQGTVLSAKALAKARVPGKYFGVVRCFRYDKVDATHLADFYQTEGIVLGEEVNLRTLLGLLKMFAEEVAGAREVKYVPGYFPFTEPSVEVHIKHPVLGWFELGGAGIFRPEVTKPFGVEVPVLAWGLGIDRMALMSLGLQDLRALFALDIEEVRLRRRSDNRAQD